MIIMIVLINYSNKIDNHEDTQGWPSTGTYLI